MSPASRSNAEARPGTRENTRESVREYYGKILQHKNQLKTFACCPTDAFPGWQKKILAEIDDEILEKFYGCGSPIPPAIEGCTVLDVGCGTGRDAWKPCCHTRAWACP